MAARPPSTTRLFEQTGITDAGWTLSGKITVSNPNDWEAITVASLTDAVDNGGTCTVAGGPTSYRPSGSLDVAYSCTYSSACPSVARTPPRLPGIRRLLYPERLGLVEGLHTGSDRRRPTRPSRHRYPGGDLGTVTEQTPPWAKSDSTTALTSRAWAANARLQQHRHDHRDRSVCPKKTVTVCVGHDLTVSKTAAGTFDRTYLWQISKDVDKTPVKIAKGGTATFNYTVVAEQTGFHDSGWTLSGKITISNPNDWEDITLTGLTDVVDNGGTCTVTGGPDVVPQVRLAGRQLQLLLRLGPALSGKNTATATWDKAPASPRPARPPVRKPSP